MPNQTARAQARRAALDAQTRMRQRRAEQERRRSALAVSVVTALAERDAVVRACEARAGQALRSLTGREGLSLREAVEWCGGAGQVSVREAARLRQVATVTEGGDGATADGDGATADGDGAAVGPVAGSAVTRGPGVTPG